MNHYHLWCNLRPGVKDLAFVDAVNGYLGYLQKQGTIVGYNIERRKFGFSPPNLGDWHIDIQCEDLAQLDRAFNSVATREGEVEKLHAAVYGSACDLVSALYRDFPDKVRTGPAK